MHLAQPAFSLQAVLDVRHSRVEAHEIALGRLLAEEKQGQVYLEALTARHAQWMAQLQRAMQGEMDVVTVDLIRSGLLSIETEIGRVKMVLKELARAVEDQRRRLIDAHQDEEVLVTLKKKRQELFLNEQKAREANLQDDVYIAQSFRQRKAGWTGQ